MRRKRSQRIFAPQKRTKFSTTTTPQSIPLWGFTEEQLRHSELSSTDFYTPKTNFPLPADGLRSYQERELDFLNLQYSETFKNTDAPLFVPTDSNVQNAKTHYLLVNTTTNKMYFTSLTESQVPFENTACFSLLEFDKSTDTPTKYIPIFNSTTWKCPKESLLPYNHFPKRIRHMLFQYLLSTVRTKDLVHNKVDSDFVLRTLSTYNSGANKNASSKYKTGDFIRRKIANEFAKYSPFPHFPLDWDPINFAHFTHQMIRSGSLLNPSYQQKPTRFSLLTIDASVNDFCLQYEHHKKGFFAVLPLNSGFERIKWKKNGTFKFAPADYGKAPQWLKKLERHPDVALVLLDKKISFDRAVHTPSGTLDLEKTGTAKFGTILAFFGFKSARLTANLFWDHNQKSMDFANDDWITKLHSVQNAFFPKIETLDRVNTAHQHEKEAANFLSSKVRQRKQTDFSPEAQKVFFKYSDYSPTNLTKYRDHFTKNGTRLSSFTGTSIEFPYLHPDFAILNQTRKTWPAPRTIPNVYMKNHLVAQLERRKNTALRKQQEKDANKLCSFCAQMGHSATF